MQLTLKDDLPFVSITMAHSGNDVIIDDVLVDTGSAKRILAAQAIAAVGIMPELDEIFPDPGYRDSRVNAPLFADRRQFE